MFYLCSENMTSNRVYRTPTILSKTSLTAPTKLNNAILNIKVD